MKKWLGKIFYWFLSWVGKSKTRTQTIDPLTAVETLSNGDPAFLSGGEKPVKTKNAVFKRDILDSLDTYFTYIKAMKKRDPESYAFYKKVGGQFHAYDDDIEQKLSEWTSLPTRWKTVRPAFGCVLWPKTGDESAEIKADKMRPRFVYFRKMNKSPPGVMLAPTGWDVYALNFHWEALEGKKVGTVETNYFTVDPQGNVSPLKIRFADTVRIVSKRKAKDGSRSCVFNRQTWGYHPIMAESARLHNDELNGDQTVETFARSIFCLAAHFYEIAQGQMIEIRAKKNNYVARFSIPGDVSTYLFRDRELFGNEKKRIFHSVRPHTRRAKGKDQKIRMHFRGERRFTWNGYAIEIVVPDKETAFFLPEFDVAHSEYGPEDTIPADAIDMGQMADIVAVSQSKGATTSDFRNAISSR